MKIYNKIFLILLFFIFCNVCFCSDNEKESTPSYFSFNKNISFNEDSSSEEKDKVINFTINNFSEEKKSIYWKYQIKQ